MQVNVSSEIISLFRKVVKNAALEKDNWADPIWSNIGEEDYLITACKKGLIYPSFQREEIYYLTDFGISIWQSPELFSK